jgi:endonuclease/exonuclease/phosphatase (EEP) superfamily protein YafD
VPLVLATGLTPLLYLPAYPALALCLLRRRWMSGAVMAGLIALHLTWVGEAMDRPVARPTGTPLRVFTANLFQSNPDSGWIGAEIAADRPDVVVVQELNQENARGLRTALRAYPHAVTQIRAGATGIGVYSRWPLTSARVTDLQGDPLVSVSVLVDGQPIRLLAVHMVAPRAGELRRWQRQFDDLERLVRRYGPGPLVVAGDFNATLDHRSLRRVLATAGLDDAARRAGRAWRPTWPRNRRIPPLLQLDHVLVSPDVGVRQVLEGRGAGSDHRPVVVDLFVPRADSTPGGRR